MSMKRETMATISIALSCLAIGLSVGQIVTERKFKATPPQVDTVFVPIDTVVVMRLPADTLSDWQMLQLAIALTESRCNPKAVGKTKDSGLLQITPIFVAEANRLAGTNYTHEDAFDTTKSLEMFDIIQSHYNKERDIDKAIHLHNPGGNAVGYAHKVQANITLVRRLEAARRAVIAQEHNKRHL